MNGVIWNKMQETFVPISSVPVYAMLQQERLKQSRELETHNFQLQNLTLTAFEEKHYLQFYDNNTKVTGICGDVWTLLAQVLNFTLQPVKSNFNSLGLTKTTQEFLRKYNMSYQVGLLDTISNNETDAIPKLEAFSNHLTDLQFTMPLWLSSHRLFFRYDGIYDSMWVTKAFSWKVWFIIFTTLLLLTVCSFWSQILLTRIRDKHKSTTFNEHIFYNFGMLCNQSYIPDALNGRSRIILETSLGLFCSILSMAYGAVLFIYMTKRILEPPFDDVDSLVNNTKHYKIVSLNGSVAEMIFKIMPFGAYAAARKTGRFVSASTVDEMHILACSTQRDVYVLYLPEEEYYARKQLMCDLTVILKLIETGLLNLLRHDWLQQETDNNIIKVTKIEAIRMDQILVMIGVLCSGVVAALVVLIIEKIVYAYTLKRS
ncbi:hypothetical protein X777_08129 [Ooceraea biroi]|uniref:Ionotropic glutamate receptor C-terminal domain-containing protein n=1 Tax=Ooceraea biroi TaxID=2015173 RepID=A0A026WA18_OOCBI|nr:hypothetical protein X777_08129 [Ooceraea biroi]